MALRHGSMNGRKLCDTWRLDLRSMTWRGCDSEVGPGRYCPPRHEHTFFLTFVFSIKCHPMTWHGCDSKYCPPRHHSHLKPSFLAFNGIPQVGEQYLPGPFPSSPTRGLVDVARHVVQSSLNPRFLSRANSTRFRDPSNILGGFAGGRGASRIGESV